MKGSLIVILFFIAGVTVGYTGIAPEGIDYSEAATWTLYLLIGVIGLEFGCRNLASAIKSLNARTVMLPICTIGGTILFAFFAALLLRRWSIFDYLAIGSGMGYYSLSSVLITDYRKAAEGLDIATQLGTIALLANIVREMLALLCAPLFRKLFGPYAPISAAGVASIDVVLPVIARVCGSWGVPVAVLHGVVVEVSVPVLVFLFCTL